MKKLSILLFAILVISTGCDMDGKIGVQSDQQSDKLSETLKAKIAEYDKPIADAKAALDALPAWQDYLKKREALEAEARKIPEFQKLQYLATRRAELEGILKGAK